VIGTDLVRVKAVEIFEYFRHTKMDLKEESLNRTPGCRTVTRLMYRLLFLMSRIGKEDAVSLNENSECSGFGMGSWVAIEERMKIALRRFEEGLKIA